MFQSKQQLTNKWYRERDCDVCLSPRGAAALSRTHDEAHTRERSYWLSSLPPQPRKFSARGSLYSCWYIVPSLSLSLCRAYIRACEYAAITAAALCERAHSTVFGTLTRAVPLPRFTAIYIYTMERPPTARSQLYIYIYIYCRCFCFVSERV